MQAASANLSRKLIPEKIDTNYHGEKSINLNHGTCNSGEMISYQEMCRRHVIQLLIKWQIPERYVEVQLISDFCRVLKGV